MQLLPLEHLQGVAHQVLATADAAEVKNGLSLALAHFGVLNFEFTYSHPFFRAVLCDDDRGFSNAGRISYPPPLVARVNRLNEAGDPLLYVSVNQYTPFEEIGVNAGDFVQVATFRLKDGATLKAGVVGEAVQVHRSGRAFSSEALGVEVAKFLSKLSLEAGRSYLYADAFLASILRDPDASQSEYLKSRILARLLFNREKPRLDAIQYPSVRHEGAMNLAIKPSAVDEKLTLSSTFVLHIKRKFDYGIYDVETVRKARGQHGDGTIDWL